ncbi:MAG: sulfotransferase domain-containing protein [Flavobacteriaceae bacterium]|nr:sulfotransferase domain-containing protein [Flavobacteriaceae bacterium]
MNFGHVAPAFMIIGTQKGGTSSLYYYLKQHPRLIAPVTKELHYFDTFDVTSKSEYLKLFPRKYFTTHISFEATPRYLYFPGTAKKIHEFNPEMKFIVILRDPAKRAFSAWNMYRQMKEDKKQLEIFRERNTARTQLYSLFYEGKDEFPSFKECINNELSPAFDEEIIEPSLIKRGYYKEQIEEYFKYFSEENILFIEFESFKSDIYGSLTAISEFLNIKGFETIQVNLEPKNKRTYTEKLSDQMYNELSNHYRLKNAGLEELIHIKLPWMQTKE